MTFNGQVEEKPGRNSQRGSQGIVRTCLVDAGREGVWGPAVHTLVMSSMAAALPGQPVAGAGVRHLRLWAQPGISYLVSSPTLREEERRKQRRKRKRICLPAVGQTPTLKVSPSTLPPTLPFLQKIPGSSRRDPHEMPGTHHPALGPFQYCWSDGFTCLPPSFD